MAEELIVNLKRSENSGFGFSLLGTTGPPHVIYDIIENSPAAESGEVEAGDIILKVNGIDVHRHTTKEVLKCLRLSDDLVTLELKRDPKIKAHIKEHLAKTSNLHYSDLETSALNKNSIYDKKSSRKIDSSTSTTSSSSSSFKTQNLQQQQQQHHRYNSEPLNRPSRIPQAVKSPPPKSVPQSPYNKKPKPSQIPTISCNQLSTSITSTSSSGSGGSAIISTSPTNYDSRLDGVSSGGGGEYSGSGNIGNKITNYNNQHYQQQQHPPSSAPPVGKARFEAFMMTGDLILNLSRTPQSSNLIAAHVKKVDSLRDSLQRSIVQPNGAIAPRASGESTPSSSSSPTQSQGSDQSGSSIKNKINKKEDLEYNLSSPNNTRKVKTTKLTATKKTTVSEHDQYNCDEFDSTSANTEQLYQKRSQLTTRTTSTETGELIERTTATTTTTTSSSSSARRRDDIEQRLTYIIDNDDETGDGGNSSMINNDLSACCAVSSSSSRNKNKNSLYYNTTSTTTAPDIDTVGSSKDFYSSESIQQQHQQNPHQHHYHHHHHHHHHCQQNSSSSSSSATVKSGEAITSSPETSFSVPTSPTSLSTPLIDKDTANSVPTSPEQSIPEVVVRRQHNGIVRKCDAAGFRTSKSEDHLQQAQRDGIGAVIPIDIDEDVNSSLNTLLDTRQDSDDSQSASRDRIVWTYNAPIPMQPQQQQQNQNTVTASTTTAPNSHSSSISSSPQRSDSPASPTSVSSSVMSSSGSKGAVGGCISGNGGNGGIISTNNSNNATGFLMCPMNGDQSVSEAISNISSPDYQDDDNLLSSKDLAGMALSDPSDSDSTILVSEAAAQKKRDTLLSSTSGEKKDHKIVIQVKGGSNYGRDRNGDEYIRGICSFIDENQHLLQNNHGYSELKDSEDELATLTEEPPTVLIGNGDHDGKESSPPVSDDGSDVESLHSYHYSPKAVDMPSAVRLAKRLYSLDGFKKSDVSRHLSKNNDFSRAVAEEYLKYFNFENQTLDQSLRDFLQQFSLSGETQERERVLVHFSKRYLDCNPGTFNSQDAVHTLTCAIMLLNTDLHGQNTGRKMTCAEFVENLAELNDGENFPKDVLKFLYQAIKGQPLEWALDDENQDQQKKRNDNNVNVTQIGSNPFLDIPQQSGAIEYKKGYVMRKCCYETNYKKNIAYDVDCCYDFFSAPFGKRSWKMFYCTLRDLVLYLHKDEHGFRKNQVSDNLHNAIRIHHALATKATDYTKKQHVFRLQTADQSEYLFQTSDSKELQSWIDTINFVCASFSAPPLEGGVGSQKRFQRPLLPSTHTKLLLKEQLTSHEQQVQQLENEILEHKKGPIPSKGLPLQNYKEKEAYLQHELKRYKTYITVLNAKMANDEQSQIFNNMLNTEDDGLASQRPFGNIQQQQQQQQQQNSSILCGSALQQPSQQQQQGQLQQQQQTNRYSYRAAIYRNDGQQDIG